MRDTLLVAGVLLLVADVLYVNARHVRLQHRTDRLEMALWADLHGTHGRPLLDVPAPLALRCVNAPTTRDLYRWLAATDGHPTRYYPGQPRLSGEPDTCPEAA